jgi:hypothetical protein
MIKYFILIMLIPLSFGTIQAQDTEEAVPPSDQFIGEWTIDLRPEPSAEGYYQPFQVTEVDGNIFTGTFYGSPIENGLVNRNWDRLYFAFTTSDASNDYYHSGYLENGTLHGISYCPNRAFTAPWTGVKKQ